MRKEEKILNLNETFGVRNDLFNKRLNEAQDFFASQYKTNIVGKDIEDILANTALFEAYTAQLTEGFDVQTAERMTSMMENTRSEILRESSIAGIQPYHSLAMPMLVKLWARLSMTNAVPTEPTKTPAFTVPFAKPYMIDAAGNKTYLPESINGAPAEQLNLVRVPKDITLTAGKVTGHDLFTGLAADTFREGIDALDRKFSVEVVKYSDKAEAVQLNGQNRLQVDAYGNLFTEVTYENDTPEIVKDKLIGHVDLEKHTLDLVSVSGKAESVEVRGYVSSEQHTNSVNISLEIARKDVNIGTAQHIEGSLPIEMLQDVNAMYDVDGAALITEQMTATSAQKVDLDIIAFLEKAYQGTDALYTKQFNVIPSSTYAMHPKDWLSGLQKTIDHVATTMRSDYKSYDAYFVIVGHPLDTDLLPNVEWTFRQAEDQYNGIDVTYSLGAVRGSTQYKVISSDLIQQGELTIFAVPTRENYKTFVYYPYTFNVTSNYLNTRNERVPSVMMTRRYTIEEFEPIIGKIIVQNNDGTVYSRS